MQDSDLLMPLVVYIVSVALAAASSELGFTALVAAGVLLAAVVLFRHPLAALKVPSRGNWRTDP